MDVVLFGAGEGVKKIKEIFNQHNIIAIADNDTSKIGEMIGLGDSHIRIIAPSEIIYLKFDYVVVSTLRQDYQSQILNQLLTLNIPLEKIITVQDGEIVSYPEILPASNTPSRKIYFDVTYITDHNALSGVPRVCNNLYRELTNSSNGVFPVRFLMNQYISSRKYDCFINGNQYDNTEYIISPTENDKILLPDYLGLVDTTPIVEWIQRNNIPSFGLIHDIIHILMRDEYKDIAEATEKYVNNFLAHLDYILCGTKTTADVLVAYYMEHKIVRNKPLPIYCFHFGFNMDHPIASVRESIKSWVRNSATFIMVGELNNPRKNHLLLLKAFQKIFDMYPDLSVQLLIFARGGLIKGPEKSLYESDANLQKHVLWIGDATDSELQWAYKHSIGLIYPSRMEGFGLPLVEAAYWGCPVMCSDIPVFRETAGDNVVYFDETSVESLYSAIMDWLQTDVHPDSRKIKKYTWKDSALEITNILNGKVEPYKIL